MLKGALGGAALVGAGAFAGRSFGSSSGELIVGAFSDYVTPEMKAAFEKETGIKVTVVEYGSVDIVLNQLRANQGQGYDVFYAPINYGEVYCSQGLLSPLDDTKLKLDAVIPSLLKKTEELGGVCRADRVLLPYCWGTEAMSYDSTALPDLSSVSYAQMWEESNENKVTVRPKSALITTGLLLDAEGKLPASNRLYDIAANEDLARTVYDQILAFAVERKKNVKVFWDDAQGQINAFQEQGCTIGLTWDGTGIRLMKSSDGRYKYIMPEEGGLGWIDNFAIPSGAKNVEQAYAWINFNLRSEVGGGFANASGYNSSVAGAIQHLTDESKATFQQIYPQEAIDNLWWWPSLPQWFLALQADYVSKYMAA
jgi:spermidine/putrescine transport system substrate-binding protein